MAPPRFWDGQQRLKSPMAPGRVERASVELEHNQASPAAQRWSDSPGSEVKDHHGAGHSGRSTWDARDFQRWEHLGQSGQGLWSWWRRNKWYEQKQAPGPTGPRYEETHWQGHNSHSRHIFWSYANLENRRQAAVASVEAVPCLGDEEVRERWQEHIEDSRDPERSAKRIHWLISRLQMQGYNRPVETEAPVQSSMADLLEIAKREQQDGVNAEASAVGENLTSTPSAVGENLTSTEQNTQNTEKDKEEDVQDDDLLDMESLYLRRRRRKRRFGREFGRGDDREDRSKLSKVQVSTELEIFGDFLHNRSKLGLLLGWLLGRVAAFLCGILFARLGTPLNIDSTIMQVLGAPVHWLIACIAAAWLGSLAVTRMENHSTWKIGCLAACVFTLVV